MLGELSQVRIEFAVFYERAEKADTSAMDYLVLAEINYARELAMGEDDKTDETTVMIRCEAQWLEERMLVRGCVTFAGLSQKQRESIEWAVMSPPQEEC